MPIRWYGPAAPTDPTYRHFNRVVNLTLHGMVFAAVHSGLWLLQEMRHPWSHLNVLTGLWLVGLAVHLTLVLKLRPQLDTDNPAT